MDATLIGVGILLIVAVALCIRAWYVGQRAKTWYPWDYLTTFASLPIWILLALFHVGSQSMGNFIEVPLILVLPGPLLAAKTVIVKSMPAKAERLSIITFGILAALILAVRLLTPEMPE